MSPNKSKDRSPSAAYEESVSPGARGGESLHSPRPGPVHFDDSSVFGTSPAQGGEHDTAHEADEEAWTSGRQRRQSGVTHRLAAAADIGGVNSIRSFTRSWARAAHFIEVIPRQGNFAFADDFHHQEGAEHGAGAGAGAGHDTDIYYHRRHEVGAGARTSLLRQHFEAASAGNSPETDGGVDNSGGGGAVDGDGRSGGTGGETRPLLWPGLSSSSNLDGKETDKSTGAGTTAAAGGRPSIDDRIRTLSASSSSAQTVRRRTSSIFAVPPHLAAPDLIIGSHYGSIRSGYGSISGPPLGGQGGGQQDMDSRSVTQANEMWRQHEASGDNAPDGETEPILVKEVEQDGKIVLTVEGQSTLPQTVFNSTNVLIGVGLLSLPMGIKYAGWLCGMIILLAAAGVTYYTAKLLARCMDLDKSLITFSDLAYISFGSKARIATSLLFTVELLAACVALVVLFSDSMVLLFEDSLSGTEWKIICCFVLIPLNFLPLRMLSFTSVLGILACLGIVSIVVIDGLLKPHTPGSLIEPAKTYLFPANWLTLPLSFGLLMSPWGGHSVFPNIYRDMRHPYKYTKGLKITFSFTYALDLTTAVAGLLMFGDKVMPAIPSNIITLSAYPRALTGLMCLLIGIIPLTKIPLNARPIISTADVLLGIHSRQVSDIDTALVGQSMYMRGILKVLVRIVVALLFLVIAVIFPAFDSIMAFMGSALCFTICIILPVAFHLKLFGDKMSRREKMVNYALIAVSVPLSLVGTVWAFLPKSLVGAE